ncbi:MAG: hypothetical protein AAGA54_10255 [Myxococcota bacterium]
MNRLFKLSPALALLGCASTPVGYETGTPPDERDAVHRTTPAPRVEDPDELLRTSVRATLAIPVEQAEDWFFARNLSEVIRGTDSIPAIRGTTTLTGAWGQPGDRRRVELSDDGTALEQVLENNLPERFTYVVWNYTSDAAKYVEYGVGEFRFEAAGEKTQVI